MREKLKTYFIITIIVAIQFIFTSCFFLEILDKENQRTYRKTRSVYSVTASDDSYVKLDAIDTNFGQEKTLEATNDNTEMQALLKFEIPDISGNIIEAVLEIYVIDETNEGPMIYTTSSTWDENSVTWNNKPSPADLIVDNIGSLSQNWLSIDVTSSVNTTSRNNSLSFIFLMDSTDHLFINSKESNKKPQLIIVTDREDSSISD